MSQTAPQAPLRNGLPIGVLMPPVVLQSAGNPRYALNSAAGRWILLACMPSAADGAPVEAAIGPQRHRFDDHFATLFVITATPRDIAEGRLADQLPGIRMLADATGEGFRALGFAPEEGGLLLLDPMLRVVAAAPLARAQELVRLLIGLAPPQLHAGVELPAPVLVLPRVLEPTLCRELLFQYETMGGTPSGFMREIGGRTVLVQDESHKRRSDVTIQESGLLNRLRSRISARLAPMLRQAFQFEATRIERYIVACYDAAEAGHFRAHRDNTTAGTAHRRFAVSINLNAGEYEGGELIFPEFGPRRYTAPTGGAVVFSCSLLHEVTPVTRGRRYAFLPFLYDEAAARIRERNRHLVAVATPQAVGEAAPLEPAISQGGSAPLDPRPGG
ncbi:2OG-Fe(II) oxygenase [Roseomonas sp. GC11]|uniref:2OG-Fe(II) oxygenase family protein n=1 Tax=Roseomonas sp. GC11 TaxID=2950546 RepID=UPI00210953BE|nr:2OG-Fe(II) oxygenase [Roseomonas sp. GC11]MCQ4159435.1 2OG-Fe(II) oxygenase [Roseomonas sp. GC11]